MKINLSISNNFKDESIIKFLNEKIDFNFLDLHNFFQSKENKILIVKKNTTNKDLLIILEKIKKQNILLITDKSTKEIFKSVNQLIFYPIKISVLIKKIKNFIEINNSFEGVILTQDNFLINLKNQKKIYVTEKEYEIINIFFKEKIIQKKIIYSQVLNLQADIDTKSLEAHLSRIRSKFLQIESPLVILPEGVNGLQIKKLIK